MVAASKLRRAQERIQHARPFAHADAAGAEQPGGRGSIRRRIRCSTSAREPRAGGKALLFVITADRGLCGSFNTNVIKAAATFITEHPERQVALGLVGRRGRDYFAKRGFEVRYERINLFAKLAVRGRPRHRADRDRGVRRRRSRQRVPRLQRVQLGDAAAGRRRAAAADPEDGARAAPRPATPAGPAVDYLYEPAPEELFKTLLPRHVEVQVYRALLESNAAFYAAQMTAMDAATRNSGEMIESLTLYMNKVRQAAITREIIEVVSGAGAL